MRPAFSMLFLTMLIGAGQGLFLALFTVWVYALLALLLVSGLFPAPMMVLAAGVASGSGACRRPHAPVLGPAGRAPASLGAGEASPEPVLPLGRMSADSTLA